MAAFTLPGPTPVAEPYTTLADSTAGDLEVVLVKRRYACVEAACPRRTFARVSDQVPPRARLSTRLRVAVLDAVVSAGRVVAEVAGAHGCRGGRFRRR